MDKCVEGIVTASCLLGDFDLRESVLLPRHSLIGPRFCDRSGPPVFYFGPLCFVGP